MTKVKNFLTKDNWTKHNLALDENDKPVTPNYSGACKWCLVGAIHKCYTTEEAGLIKAKIYDYLRLFNFRDFQTGIGAFNDTHTFEEVIALAEELDI